MNHTTGFFTLRMEKVIYKQVREKMKDTNMKNIGTMI